MAGEEVFIAPFAGLIAGIIPTLQIIAVIAFCSLIVFLIYRRKDSFMKMPTSVLIKRRRGDDYSPELVKGGARKNASGQDVYRLSTGEEIPLAMFHDLKNFGKKGTFVEILEKERGQFVPAPSPFVNAPRSEFTQSDVNWLIDQHKNDIRMFEKKNLLKEWLPIMVPAITIIIVVLALILFITNGLMPLIDKGNGIASANAQFAATWANVTERLYNMTTANNQAIVVPSG